MKYRVEAEGVVLGTRTLKPGDTVMGLQGRRLFEQGLAAEVLPDGELKRRPGRPKSRPEGAPKRKRHARRDMRAER